MKRVIFLFLTTLIILSPLIYVLGKSYAYYRDNNQYRVDGKATTEKLFESYGKRAGLSIKELEKLGWINHFDRKNMFYHFKKEKSESIIRIGLFGDSFTFGDEVKDFADYPSHLKSFFSKSKIGNVEILNFGIGGYGFTQAYNMWKLVGQKYNLDVVVFGPVGFQTARDITFSEATNELRNIIRSRFILKSNKFKEIMLNGESNLERLVNYNSFIGDWNAFRYDIIPPVFLSSIIEPSKKTNPFYYHSDPESEITELHKRMIRSLGKSNKLVIIFNEDEEVIERSKNISSNILHLKSRASRYFPSPRVQAFPYSRNGHYSSAGNQLIAKELFQFLIGENKVSLNALKYTQEISHLDLIKKLPLGQKVILSSNEVEFGFLGSYQNDIEDHYKLLDLNKKYAVFINNNLKRNGFLITEVSSSLGALSVGFEKEIKKVFPQRVGNFFVYDLSSIGGSRLGSRGWDFPFAKNIEFSNESVAIDLVNTLNGIILNFDLINSFSFLTTARKFELKLNDLMNIQVKGSSGSSFHLGKFDQIKQEYTIEKQQVCKLVFKRLVCDFNEVSNGGGDIN